MVGLSKKQVFPKTKGDSITGQDRAQKHCDFRFSQIEKKSKVASLQLDKTRHHLCAGVCSYVQNMSLSSRWLFQVFCEQSKQGMKYCVCFCFYFRVQNRNIVLLDARLKFTGPYCINIYSFWYWYWF